MRRRVNIRGIVVNDAGEVFTVKHRDRLTNSESVFWAIPGGGLDSNEALDAGLKREFEEELGIEAEVGKLLFIQQFIHTHQDGAQTEKIEMFFHVTNTHNFQREIDLSKTTHGHELTRTSFIDPHVHDLLPNFLQSINLLEHIQSNNPVIYFNNLNESSR